MLGSVNIITETHNQTIDGINTRATNIEHMGSYDNNKFGVMSHRRYGSNKK